MVTYHSSTASACGSVVRAQPSQEQRIGNTSVRVVEDLCRLSVLVSLKAYSPGEVASQAFVCPAERDSGTIEALALVWDG